MVGSSARSTIITVMRFILLAARLLAGIFEQQPTNLSQQGCAGGPAGFRFDLLD